MATNHELSNNITCPYCGYEDDESHLIDDNEGLKDCDSCGRAFAFRRIITVEYSTGEVANGK